MDDSIYELTYTEEDRSGKTILRKLTIVIDPPTRLPQEIQAFYSSPPDEEWNCEYRWVFEYPGESEIASVVEQ